MFDTIRRHELTALDELRTDDLAGLSDAGLATDIDEIERAFRVLEAERGRRLIEFERRRAFANDGHLSTAAWLSDRHGVSRRSAHVATRRASALSAMPVAASALGAGELSSSALDLLASARERCPEAYEQTEEALVEAARTMPFGELCRTVGTWRIAADRERALEDEDRAFKQRHLDVVPTSGGLVRVDGELDPESGQSLITRSGRSPTLKPVAVPPTDRTHERPHSDAPTRSGKCAEAGSRRSSGRSSVARCLTSS